MYQCVRDRHWREETNIHKVWDMAVLFILCDPCGFDTQNAKFLVAMVAHVICSCAICEPKPLNRHAASLSAACLVAINLGPRTATTTLTVTAYVVHLIELAEPHCRGWTSCTIAYDCATSTYVLQSRFRLHGLSHVCHVICLFDCG